MNRIMEFCIQPEIGKDVFASAVATGVSIGSDIMRGTSVGVRSALVDDMLMIGVRIWIGVMDAALVATGVSVTPVLRLPFGLMEKVRL